MRKLHKLFLCLVLVFTSACFQKAGSSEMTVTLLNAGKADAILIETGEGTVMIDTGLDENKQELLDELENRNITSLYALIITHFDKDHVGGADVVLANLDVKYVYTSYEAKDSGDIEEFTQALSQSTAVSSQISGTQTFALGGIRFTVYGASGSYDKDESNNSSLIVTAECGSDSYLFMGDAQDERIREFLSVFHDTVSFLKVPYHGHKQDALGELAEAVKPQVSAITCSSDEPGSKELAKTVRILEEAGSRVYLTYEGTVMLRCTQEGFAVSQD